MRVGYGISNSGELIEMMAMALPTFSVNGLAQVAAYAALDDFEFVEKVKKHVINEKRRYYNFFEETGIYYIKSETNFILIKIDKMGQFLTDRLKKMGIIVRCMGEWGFSSDYVRITIGSKEQNSRLMEAMAEVLKLY